MPKSLEELMILKAELEILMNKKIEESEDGGIGGTEPADHQLILKVIQSFTTKVINAPPEAQVDEIFARYPEPSQEARDKAAADNPFIVFAAPLVAVALAPIDAPAPVLAEADADLARAIAESILIAPQPQDRALEEAIALSKAIEESRDEYNYLGGSAANARADEDEGYLRAIAESTAMAQSKEDFYAKVGSSLQELRGLIFAGEGAAVNPFRESIEELKEQLIGQLERFEGDESPEAMALMLDITDVVF